jgi:hypothetical protein
MDWREFEKLCEKRLNKIKDELSQELRELIGEDIDEDLIKVDPQRKTTSPDGETKRVDLYIAERRQGGRRYVIDCKHFPKAQLNNHEVDTTLEYKARHRASKAFMFVSDVSNCPASFMRYAEKMGIAVLTVDTSMSSRLPLLGWLFDASEMDELREELRSNYLLWRMKKETKKDKE